jgi:hypothetical protein
VKIIIVVLAVLALFYFDSEEFNGDSNHICNWRLDRHCHHSAGALLHRQLFAGKDRGQVNAQT